MQKIVVDHFGNGVAQVTDGQETIYLTQGRHKFAAPVTAIDGYNVRIMQSNTNQPVALLSDAPVEVAKQGAIAVETKVSKKKVGE